MADNKNYSEAVKLLLKAAASGDADAPYKLGECFLLEKVWKKTVRKLTNGTGKQRSRIM